MEQQKSLVEVVQTEKQLTAVIHSRGILHGDFLELYRVIRTGYEKFLLSSDQMLELQEIEYHLWKLHYKLIDEFRRRIRQLSTKAEHMEKDAKSRSQCNDGKELEGFESFLSEATEFYGNLIVKLRKNYGLPAEIFLKNNVGFPLIEPTKLCMCQYTCHRLLICLGDLARYNEVVKRPESRQWSTAATYYIEASRTWPDSGNPHNQLALLATYVDDAFLALYHCVRSLAVKEPFRDAWSNLMLVLEESRSTPYRSLPSQMQIDFLNPSKRIYLQKPSPEENGSSDNGKSEDLQNVYSDDLDVWSILVRTISFLLTGSSVEELPCAIATALHSLEALLSMDNTKLFAALESYKFMDSPRTGPYRGIQLVSIFIFIAQSLTENQETEKSTGINDKRSSFAPLAFATIFICMGRLTERCMKGNTRDICPLLPAVLEFLEWLAGSFDKAEAHQSDERVMNAISYFFRTLVDLLDRLDQYGGEISFHNAALWEDHELRGFYHSAQIDKMLNFTTHLEFMENFNDGNEIRCQRILRSAKRIMGSSKSFRDLIGSHNLRRLNSVETAQEKSREPAAVSVSTPEAKEHNDQRTQASLNKTDTNLQEEIQNCSASKSPSMTDEDEVILFNPITRRNSAPLYISKRKPDLVSAEVTKTQEKQEYFNDEFLRRAASLSIGPNSAEVDSFSFCPTTSSSGFNWSFKQQEPTLRESTTQPARPPSLSAWVLDRGSQEVEKERASKNSHKQKLSPINEIPSTSSCELPVNEVKDSKATGDCTSTISHDSSPYTSPTPSAPLLPDDAIWSRGMSSTYPEYKSNNDTDGILGAAPVSPYPYRPAIRPPMGLVPGVSGLVNGYPPMLGMSSSEWLYHYRNSQNPGNPTHHVSPIHFNDPVLGRFHSNEFDLCDQWGNRFISDPMICMGTPSPQMYPNPTLGYGFEEQKREKLFLDYQRPYPYVCGVGTELSCDQPQLLQYLKEKEWQMQPGFQLRGPTFMGN